MNWTFDLLLWYDNAKRTLPWRETGDPYCIWLSEIMLQQTRVDQGMPYYQRFTERFPDVYQLADAQEQEWLQEASAHFLFKVARSWASLVDRT